METALGALAHYCSLVINVMALVVIVTGSVEAFVASARALATYRNVPGAQRRSIWVRYARWLVAGLTFQLGADIVETMIAPTWDEIGRLAAIAAIRTFLDFFLERDIDDVRKLQIARGEVPALHEPGGGRSDG
jgi:uncharacterized membrane protein